MDSLKPSRLFRLFRAALALTTLVAACAVLPVVVGARSHEALALDSSARLFDRSELQSSTGTASINSGTASYTAWQPLITITPQSNQALQDAKVVIDLAQASTGFAALNTSATITFSIGRKVDGTNLRTSTNLATTAVSGTNSAGMSIELSLGVVGPNETVTVQVKVSGVTNPIETLPYVVYYRAGARAQVTPAS